MGSINYHPHDIDVRGSPDTVSERETNERTDAANTVATLAALQFEDDFELHAVEFYYDIALAEFDGTSGAINGTFDMDFMVTTRDNIPADWAEASGVYYATRFGVTTYVVYENTTDNTGGGAGGESVTISGVIDPRKLRRDVPQELNGGQRLRIVTENLSDWTGFDDAFEHGHLKAVGEVTDR